MRIFDTFLFFNELELLDIRLHTLNDHVDYFVLSEATKTFSGKAKPLYFMEHRSAFRRFHGKIIHHIVDDTPDDFAAWRPPNAHYTDRDRSYLHKSGGIPLKNLSLTFQREVYQRDALINPLLKIAADEDIILISDLDEIPNPALLGTLDQCVRDDVLYHFCQKWYMYYLNVYSDREWFGTRACRFRYLKRFSVDLLRYHLEDRRQQQGEILEDGGWHFSFLGGADRVRAKLDAYDYQGRRTRFLLRFLNWVFADRIERKLGSNRDIFIGGRKLRTEGIDASFPEYVRRNQEKFAALIKP